MYMPVVSNSAKKLIAKRGVKGEADQQKRAKIARVLKRAGVVCFSTVNFLCFASKQIEHGIKSMRWGNSMLDVGKCTWTGPDGDIKRGKRKRKNGSGG